MFKGVIIGNLGSDPDMRYSASGAPFLRFNVAANIRVKDQDGEFRDKTEWVRVTTFGNRAETLAQYLRKGSRVYVEGRLEARPWTDQQGQVRAGLELIGDTVEFMSPREDSGGERPAQARAPLAGVGAGKQESYADEDLENLPF